MPAIHIDTKIAASMQVCFDCSRNIDLHTASMSHTGERAVAGRISGLIELNESVTWRAKHLGIWQNLTTVITEMDPPYFFVDEQVDGVFSSFRHQHIFEPKGNDTLMKDIFVYRSPMGLLGRLVDILFLKRYMTRLLEQRNAVIKVAAEKTMKASS